MRIPFWMSKDFKAEQNMARMRTEIALAELPPPPPEQPPEEPWWMTMPVVRGYRNIGEWGTQPVTSEPTMKERVQAEVLEGTEAQPQEVPRWQAMLRELEPLDYMPMYGGTKKVIKGAGKLAKETIEGKLAKAAPKVEAPVPKEAPTAPLESPKPGGEVPPIPPEKPPTAIPEAPVEDSLTKIIRAIDAAEPASIEARLKYMTPDLRRKVAVYREQLAQAKTLEEAQKARASLKGVLDIGDYKPKLEDFSDVDKTFALEQIMNSEMKSLEKGNVIDAFVKVIKGERLQPHETKMLRGIFNQPKEPIGVPGAQTYVDKNVKMLDFFNSLSGQQESKLNKSLKAIGLNLVDALGIPKAMKFMLDFSFMFRQLGMVGARHPVKWASKWKPYAQAMRSEEVALKLDNVIRTDPAKMDAISKLGLDLYDVKPNASYWDRPETMASKIAEKYIPGVRMSNRGAAVALNDMLSDVGVDALKNLKNAKATEAEYKAMGQLLNALVGRGEMPKFLHGTAGDILNKMLASPRYTWSKFSWLPKLVSPSKTVRQESWSTLLAWAGMSTAIMGMAKLSGLADVEGDPRSSDQMKIRVGNKRIDIWTGYAQIIRAAAQISTGTTKTASGEIKEISRADAIARFLQSKESPGIGALVSLLSGKNYVGEKVDLTSLEGIGKYIAEALTPASLEEMVNAYAIEGPASAALSSIGVGGVGVSTYKTKSKGFKFESKSTGKTSGGFHFKK